MAIPERDPAYTNDTNRTNIYSRESSSTAWFVGIIVVLALLAIGYLIFSANSGPSTTAVDVNNSPAVTAPGDTNLAPTPAPADNNATPMTETPAPAPANDATPPANDAAPAAQ